MNRSIGHPDYVYQPWSEDRRREASIRAKRRLKDEAQFEAWFDSHWTRADFRRRIDYEHAREIARETWREVRRRSRA